MYLEPITENPNNSSAITILNSLNIKELVDNFIVSQDVKTSSKELYNRTLKQYFNYKDKNNHLNLLYHSSHNKVN